MPEFKQKYDYKTPVDVAILAKKTIAMKDGNTFEVWEGRDKQADRKLQLSKSKDGKFLILKAFNKLQEASQESTQESSLDDFVF